MEKRIKTASPHHPQIFKGLERKDLPKIESLGAGVPKILLESGITLKMLTALFI